MRIEYRRIDSLPRLAWSMHLRAGTDAITVCHGPWVEVRNNWFVEGAWSGAFADGGFHRSHALMGSGARIVDDQVIVSTATHFHDSLYSIRRGDDLFVSNSKVFALALAGDELDPLYPFYSHDLATFRSQGLRRTVRALPTRDGRQLHQHSFVNVRIDRSHRMHVEAKHIAPEPASYEEYRALLGETTRAIVANAQDANRVQSFRLASMVSRGYDSPASAVFAAENGCREAITFAKLDADDHYMNDGGAEIAATLGMECTEYSRTAFKRLPVAPDAEFCACPNGGHVQMAIAESQFAGTLLFQGHNGDLAWGLARSQHFPNLETHERRVWITLADSSETEFRLRVGFINYSVAYVGAHHHKKLREIGLSPAMKEWSIGGEYDRPIPRRIAEDAGVPRNLFGQKKVTGLNHTIPRYGLTPAGEREFAEFYASIEHRPSVIRRLAFATMVQGHRLGTKFVKSTNQIGDRLNWRTVIAPRISLRYQGPISKYDFAIQWGVQSIMDRYLVDSAIGHSEVAGTTAS